MKTEIQYQKLHTLLSNCIQIVCKKYPNLKKNIEKYHKLSEELIEIGYYSSKKDYFLNLVNNKLNKISQLSEKKNITLRIDSGELEGLNAFFDINNKLSDSQKGFKIISELESITSKNDLRKPEFPIASPAYPATPHYLIEYRDFQQLWIKDESYNTTGTHKDRMAWEVVKYYKDKITNDTSLTIPKLSIITAGAAGISIQNLMNRFGIKIPLKVIVDKNISENIKKALINSGCEKPVEIDLLRKKITSENILEITKNKGGIDLTYGKGIEEIQNQYYDWLSFEILNLNPDICIIPFGTGGLFKNILNICKNQIISNVKDARLLANEEKLKKMIFIGVTAELKNTKTSMDKLFTRYNTYKHFNIHNYFNQLNPESKIVELEEMYVEKAGGIAKNFSIDCEPSGIAALGYFLKMENNFNHLKDKRIVIINTGRLKLEKFL